MKILTAEAMRAVDRAAIEDYGIPSLVLMENAGRGAADLLRALGVRGRVVVCCGKGNNGGDGLALARHLAGRGYQVAIFLVTGGREPGGDAGAQLTVCRRMGLAITAVGQEGGSLAAAVETAAGRDLVVDALFGTGLARPLEGFHAELVTALADLPMPRIAVDLPSGLDASRADPPGPCFRADLTVTFAAPKVAHVLDPAAEAVGALVVADLGIPPHLVEAAPTGLNLLRPEELAPALRPRAPRSHKGDYGHLLLVAGSPGKAGAAILAARAAVRSGAGLVTAAVPAPILPTVDLGSIESMTLALPCDPSGGVAGDAAGAIGAASAGKTAVALGPGLGLAEGTVAAVRAAVAACELPLLLDADGINAFAGAVGLLAGRLAPMVLTPHPGELARLLGVKTAEVLADRIAAARRATAETGGIVVLKGHQTLVADPEGQVYVNPTGNPGMATGGTGDVLTGLIGGLLAQRYEPLTAALLGVYLHGLAGDLAAERTGEAALAAGDLLETLPGAFDTLAQGQRDLP